MIKRLLLILLIVIVLVAGWFIYSFYFRTATYEKLVGERLEQAVRKGTDSLYRLDYEHVGINPVTLSISIGGLHFYPDSIVLERHLQRGDTPVLLLDMTLRKISFKDLSAKAFLKEKDLILSSVIVNEADIAIKKIGVGKPSEGYQSDSMNSARVNIYEQLKKDIKSIRIDSLAIMKSQFHYISHVRTHKKFDVSNLSLTLRNILLDSSSVHDRNRFFLAENCTVKLDSYEMALNELYKLQSGSLKLEIPSGTGTVKDFRIIPLQSEKGFVAKVVTDKKRVSIEMPEIKIQGLDAAAFFEDEHIRAEKLSINDMNIDVYHNRYSPKDMSDKVGEYPHQLLMALNIDTDISSIDVKNAKVSYRQLNPKSTKEGRLYFTGINAEISNITNNADSLNRNGVVTMKASGLLLGKTRLNSVWKFYNLTKDGFFTIEGNLNPLKGSQLNEVLVPLGMVRIDEGRINSLNFSISGNDYKGEVQVTFFYENLKVAVLGMSDKKIEKEKSKSFLANSLFINENSRPGDKIPDKIKGDFKRDKARNIFHLAWNSLLAGMKNTLQYGKPAAKIMKGLKKTEQP